MNAIGTSSEAEPQEWIERRRRIETLSRRTSTFRSYQSRIPPRAAVGALLIVSLEAYRWLDSGIWQPLDAWSIVRLFTTSGWLVTPDSWLGLHALVAWFLGLPLFVSVPFMGWAIAGGSCAAMTTWCEGSIAAVKQAASMGVLDRPRQLR
jgi:hypothetical protein